MNERKAAKEFLRTDAGNAELFAHLHGDKVRFDHKQQRWLIWNGKKHRWTPDTQGKVRLLMKDTARRGRLRLAQQVSDDDERKKQIQWAMQSEGLYRIQAALELAKSPISDSGDGWDSNPWLVGVQNGIVDLRTGKLREATQQDRITKFSPVRYDAAAKCPRFEQFLEEVFDGDQQLIRFVQKAAGYSLTGSTQEQCVFACWGGGANGKTTLLETLLFVFGDYAVDLPFMALEANRNSGVPNEGMKLVGARFVKAVEIREGRRIDEARLKAWTGGDSLTARPLYKEYVTFQPTHKLWLAFNHKPVIADESKGMWRRIRLIPFTQIFEGERKDKGLLEKLKAEAPGILNWVIEGCRLWRKEGLEPPDAISKATSEYQEESDALSAFLDECCTVNSAASVGASELWDAYVEWADASGAVGTVTKRVRRTAQAAWIPAGTG